MHEIFSDGDSRSGLSKSSNHKMARLFISLNTTHNVILCSIALTSLLSKKPQTERRHCFVWCFDPCDARLRQTTTHDWSTSEFGFTRARIAINACIIKLADFRKVCTPACSLQFHLYPHYLLLCWYLNTEQGVCEPVMLMSGLFSCLFSQLFSPLSKQCQNRLTESLSDLLQSSLWLRCATTGLNFSWLCSTLTCLPVLHWDVDVPTDYLHLSFTHSLNYFIVSSLFYPPASSMPVFLFHIQF